MNHTIKIVDSEKSRTLQFPSLPESISFSNGSKYASYNILDLGEASFPSGRGCKTVEWSGVLYGEAFKDNKFLVQQWKDPEEVQRLFSEWTENGTKLKLVISGTPINMDVSLASYKVDYSGAYGNYNYSVSFTEYRDLSVTVIKKSTTTTTTQPETKRNTKTASTTHTIQSGDTLWALAYRFYKSGSKYTVIYNANKDVIEAAAKKHGKKSSDNGHWIYPGTVLTIPTAS